jgi:hypothetical protein
MDQNKEKPTKQAEEKSEGVQVEMDPDDERPESEDPQSMSVSGASTPQTPLGDATCELSALAQRSVSLSKRKSIDVLSVESGEDDSSQKSVDANLPPTKKLKKLGKTQPPTEEEKKSVESKLWTDYREPKPVTSHAGSMEDLLTGDEVDRRKKRKRGTAGETKPPVLIRKGSDSSVSSKSGDQSNRMDVDEDSSSQHSLVSKFAEGRILESSGESQFSSLNREEDGVAVVVVTAGREYIPPSSPTDTYNEYVCPELPKDKNISPTAQLLKSDQQHLMRTFADPIPGSCDDSQFSLSREEDSKAAAADGNVGARPTSPTDTDNEAECSDLPMDENNSPTAQLQQEARVGVQRLHTETEVASETLTARTTDVEEASRPKVDEKELPLESPKEGETKDPPTPQEEE